MKLGNGKTLQVWFIAITFAVFWGWIEYNILNIPPYGRIIFLMTYAVLVFAFFRANLWAALGSLTLGYIVEHYSYNYFADLALQNRLTMLALGLISGVLFILSVIEFDKGKDKQKFEVQEGPPTLVGKEAKAFLEDIKKPPTSQQIEIVKRAVEEFKPEESQLEIKVSEEEKFDPEKEELKKRFKEKYLK